MTLRIQKPCLLCANQREYSFKSCLFVESIVEIIGAQTLLNFADDIVDKTAKVSKRYFFLSPQIASSLILQFQIHKFFKYVIPLIANPQITFFIIIPQTTNPKISDIVPVCNSKFLKYQLSKLKR
jgi:hypothetical protein